LKIMKGQYAPLNSGHFSKDILKLVDSLLNVVPERRPSINEILSKCYIYNII
jgi:hypothetical protein